MQAAAAAMVVRLRQLGCTPSVLPVVGERFGLLSGAVD